MNQARALPPLTARPLTGCSLCCPHCHVRHARAPTHHPPTPTHLVVLSATWHARAVCPPPPPPPPTHLVVLTAT